MGLFEELIVPADWIEPLKEPVHHSYINTARATIANSLAWAVKTKGVRLEVAGPIWIESAQEDRFVIRLGGNLYGLPANVHITAGVLGLIAKAIQVERASAYKETSA